MLPTLQGSDQPSPEAALPAGGDAPLPGALTKGPTLAPSPLLQASRSSAFPTKLYCIDEIKFKLNWNLSKICPCKFGRQFQTRVARYFEQQSNHWIWHMAYRFWRGTLMLAVFWRSALWGIKDVVLGIGKDRKWSEMPRWGLRSVTSFIIGDRLH